MSTHTKEPWLLSKDGARIYQTNHVTRDVWEIPRCDKDLPRIVACVNALAGIENPQEALREVQDAVRMLIMRASSEMKRFPVSEQVKRREHIERARKALAALSPQPTATEEGQG